MTQPSGERGCAPRASQMVSRSSGGIVSPSVVSEPASLRVIPRPRQAGPVVRVHPPAQESGHPSGGYLGPLRPGGGTRSHEGGTDRRQKERGGERHHHQHATGHDGGDREERALPHTFYAPAVPGGESGVAEVEVRFDRRQNSALVLR